MSTNRTNNPPRIAEALPEGLKDFNERDINWLWFYMATFYKIPHENVVDLDFKIKQISQCLTNTLDPNFRPDVNVSSILNTHFSQIIRIDYFDWINSKDYRQLIWVSKNLLPDMALYFSGISFKSHYDSIIKFFDRIPWNTEGRIQFLSDKKQEWARFKTPDVDLKWLDINNTTQLNWAWTYLYKFLRNVSVPIPVTNEEFYGAILASFDAMSYGHYADKQLFISKMKKTWSQKKFRDSGKAKKPYHLPLTKQAKKKLEELAQLYGVKSNDLLENLISETYKKDILDEKGKKQYQP